MLVKSTDLQVPDSKIQTILETPRVIKKKKNPKYPNIHKIFPSLMTLHIMIIPESNDKPNY